MLGRESTVHRRVSTIESVLPCSTYRKARSAERLLPWTPSGYSNGTGAPRTWRPLTTSVSEAAGAGHQTASERVAASAVAQRLATDQDSSLPRESGDGVMTPPGCAPF